MNAITDYPIHELMTKRWSPYCFDERPVNDEDLRSLFEAARWAPSSYNEQPWSYVVAKKENPDEFKRVLSCLVEANQVWAKEAPVLALCITSLKFARNDKPNRAAVHDLGLANSNLVLEAAALGLVAHQMIGILPDKAREIYQVPEGHDPMTAIAIGYAGYGGNLPPEIRERDAARRPRKALKEFVFSGKWGTTSGLVS
ncbi:MAG: nitroreductase family protein [Verrucomicrobia bacterium]|nr:nitroreductase family protein [Verrucomicrobiota bacterium]